MNRVNWAVFFLLLAGGVALAAVYKWVDESGRIHYGDAPPQDSDAQPVAVPAGPSPAEVERARKRMRERMDTYKEFSDQPGPSEPVERAPQQAETGVVIPDDVMCMSPLSDLVPGPSAELYTPITPTSLTKAQQNTLTDLFEKAEAGWVGTIIEVACLGGSSEPRGKITNFRARMTVDWDARNSQLTLDTDSVGKETGVTKRRIQRFEVADAFYFTDIKATDVIAQDGNRVEVLQLDKDRVSFLIKRHIPTATGGRRPQAEVRQLEISGRTLRLIELYYQQEMLTGSTTWVFNR